MKWPNNPAASGCGSGAAEVGDGAGAQLPELIRGRAPVRGEAGRIPLREPGASFVCALAEREQGGPGRLRLANGLVGQESQGPRPVLGPLADGQRLVAHAGRLGSGEGVDLGGPRIDRKSTRLNSSPT